MYSLIDRLAADQSLATALRGSSGHGFGLEGAQASDDEVCALLGQPPSAAAADVDAMLETLLSQLAAGKWM